MSCLDIPFIRKTNSMNNDKCKYIPTLTDVFWFSVFVCMLPVGLYNDWKDRKKYQDISDTYMSHEDQFR